MPKIRRALLSVYDKRGILPFARVLIRRGIKILSTGKTASFLKKRGIPVQEVSAYTGYPELLDGRVKTLHPKIHAAILADRKNRSHMRSLKDEGIEPIDLVVVDLYPFEEMFRKGTKDSEAIEQIDVGGITLLRAAAKNSKFVTVVPGPECYGILLEEFKKRSSISEETNRYLAYQAFQKTSRYDRAIRDFFGKAKKNEAILPETLELTYQKIQDLRYGENPHQKGALYGTLPSEFSTRPLSLQGKLPSFNNLLDLDSAYRLVKEFKRPCASVIKHATPCGVSLGKTIQEAFQKAWKADPESAFGGVVGVNRTLDVPLAKKILESGFLEVVTFPKIEKGALRLLKRKKNLRLVPFDRLEKNLKELEFRQISGGHLLVQTGDETHLLPSRLRFVTTRRPTAEERKALLFAFHVAKHVRSNAIVIAKGETTIGIGGGQPSRVGSVRLALEKAGEEAEGAVLASDGFFPFPDSVELAAERGIRAIIQPGGSIRDREVIEACNRLGIAMVFTGIRHFRH